MMDIDLSAYVGWSVAELGGGGSQPAGNRQKHPHSIL